MSIEKKFLNPPPGTFSAPITLIGGGKFVPSKRQCPLCNSALKLYYINLDLEMVVLCENSYCHYPFGYERLQIVTDESQVVDDPGAVTDTDWLYIPDGVTPPSIRHHTGTISTAYSSDIDQLNTCDSEDSSYESQSMRLTKRFKERLERKKKKQAIEKTLQNLKKINSELHNITKENDMVIKSENMLEHLLSLQLSSGKKLLTEAEMKKIKQIKPDFDMGELKITINPDTVAATGIQIQILDPNITVQNFKPDSKDGAEAKVAKLPESRALAQPESNIPNHGAETHSITQVQPTSNLQDVIQSPRKPQSDMTAPLDSGAKCKLHCKIPSLFQIAMKALSQNVQSEIVKALQSITESQPQTDNETEAQPDTEDYPLFVEVAPPYLDPSNNHQLAHSDTQEDQPKTKTHPHSQIIDTTVKHECSNSQATQVQQSRPEDELQSINLETVIFVIEGQNDAETQSIKKSVASLNIIDIGDILPSHTTVPHSTNVQTEQKTEQKTELDTVTHKLIEPAQLEHDDFQTIAIHRHLNTQVKKYAPKFKTPRVAKVQQSETVTQAQSNKTIQKLQQETQNQSITETNSNMNKETVVFAVESGRTVFKSETPNNRLPIETEQVNGTRDNSIEEASLVTEFIMEIQVESDSDTNSTIEQKSPQARRSPRLSKK